MAGEVAFSVVPMVLEWQPPPAFRPGVSDGRPRAESWTDCDRELPAPPSWRTRIPRSRRRQLRRRYRGAVVPPAAPAAPQATCRWLIAPGDDRLRSLRDQAPPTPAGEAVGATESG